MVEVRILNIDKRMFVQGGTTLMELVGRIAADCRIRPICALVNNKTENLSYRIYAPKTIEFLDAESPSGHRVYVRSLCMLLYRALRTVAPGLRLRIEHSISKGYLCHLIPMEQPSSQEQSFSHGQPSSQEQSATEGAARTGGAMSTAGGDSGEVSEALLEALLVEMRSLVERDIPFECHEALTSEVMDIFRAQGLDSKVRLLETLNQLYTQYYTLDGVADGYYSALAPSTGYIRTFDLKPYKGGFLLMGPDPEHKDVPQQPVTQEKMYDAYEDYLRFNRAIKVNDVGDLNMAVQAHKAAELINVAEAMHDKILGRIADDIAQRNNAGGARIITLAGPSSSGKTTTAKRLGIQLMTNLLTPKMISLDDYFVNRDRTPLDADGEYDYESLYALDLDRLNDDLRRLLAGEEINLPTYSFELGARVERPRPLRLEKDEVLLIEGIHGLNPELTRALPADDIYKVYVSALTSLSIDEHNWISTTDNRLLRRIVRDHKYRHTSALDTIRRWPSVRRGEEKWIFPFQENADSTFNSSLIFELGVMKSYAEPLLHEVPHTSDCYAEAYRLARFLGYFESIPAEQVPHTSLLREFLGGSSFHY